MTLRKAVVSTLVYLFYIFRQKSAFQFRIKDCTFSKEILSEIFKIGVPTLVFQLLTSISISLINNAAGNYGDSAIAGMGVVTRLISMGSTTDSITYGSELYHCNILCKSDYGAGQGKWNKEGF